MSSLCIFLPSSSPDTLMLDSALQAVLLLDTSRPEPVATWPCHPSLCSTAAMQFSLLAVGLLSAVQLLEVIVSSRGAEIVEGSRLEFPHQVSAVELIAAGHLTPQV